VSAPITIIVVDDEPDFLELCRERFRRDARLQMVGTAGDAAEALALAEQHRPNVAIVDVYMPGIDGYEIARRLRTLLPDTRVIMTSADSRVYYQAEVRSVGALAFIDKKDLDPKVLLETLADAA
jgi:two-component system response regulator DesR